MDYKDKTPGYYANIRHDLLNLIDRGSNGLKVIEIGAAYGETLYYLKQEGIAAEAIGVELYEDLKNRQNYKPLDRFIFGNMEEIDFPEYEGYFDLILLPDVLEHLIEPKNVLEKVRRYLKPGGQILVSMPNIRHYSAFVRVFIKGDFRYEESGLFDYTHMRFYCRKNMIGLLEASGFRVTYQEGSIRKFKGTSAAKTFNRITMGLFEEFLSTQYFFKAVKKQ